MQYWTLFVDTLRGYADYLYREITHPGIHNYFYMLIAVSLLVYALELMLPWRKHQRRIRRDFWLDAFYMFFNFFLFSLLGFAALFQVGVQAFNDILGRFGIENLVAIHIEAWPNWVQLLVLFVVRDFVHWNVHRLLHRVPLLWEFHKVHHSVIEMGFAAHLRFHWMETVVYRTLEYIPLAMIGFGIDDFMIVHATALTIGHFNHANLKLRLGPLRYVLNNPQMHIWHHMKRFPSTLPYGVNFGISLSLWDYLFGKAHIPSSGRDIELGFDHVEEFPVTFLEQVVHPWRKQGAA
ncbi:MAG: sterol desaturase family protein [Candidatus Latescibacterota bacterium]|nr:MAG: sterol desaturase family protein [Candidatus Latescibacterota bacterium]